MSNIEKHDPAPEEALAVILTIRGEQVYDGIDPDTAELVTEGLLQRTKDGLRLSYQETELTGMEGTTTAFEVQGGRVILSRTGSVSSQMIFEEGRQHTSLYTTPYGEMTVDVQTSRLRHNLTERGGVMDIHYAIAVGNTVTGRSRVQIRVKRKG